MSAIEIFEIKKPRVERLVRFLVRQKGITWSYINEIEQEAFLELWRRCLNHPNNPEKVGSLMAVRYAIKMVVTKLVKYSKTKNFSSYEDGEDDNFSGDFRKLFQKEPFLTVDGVEVTYDELAIDLLEVYNDKNLSREEAELKLNIKPGKIHLARKFLGLLRINNKECNHSLNQMRLQIESPVRMNKKATRPRNTSVLVCNDCHKEIEVFHSMIESLNGRKYYCKKCIPKHKKNKPIKCKECGKIRSKSECTHCKRKEEEKKNKEYLNQL